MRLKMFLFIKIYNNPNYLLTYVQYRQYKTTIQKKNYQKNIQHLINIFIHKNINQLNSSKRNLLFLLISRRKVNFTQISQLHNK